MAARSSGRESSSWPVSSSPSSPPPEMTLSVSGNAAASSWSWGHPLWYQGYPGADPGVA
eukprot:CAMPEP_0197499410 /NCGR_PEP_ID=MMETSP1311-20131121/61007_1 /TAXON_ID=464262 /ORGANISM="Genus nov. species nov., Strain RCC856" /LENGTH=58 /DNA_ID=CAMNT_0043045153 /DNA_START=367 /DNA_END=543 /DNA_ORIENTATION=+